MATIFQKMFLSQQQIADINQKQAMMNVVQSQPISNTTYTSKGNMTRRFAIKTPDYNIYAECTRDMSRPADNQLCFSFRFKTHNKTVFAAHSDIDLFAKTAYITMCKCWKDNRPYVR